MNLIVSKKNPFRFGVLKETAYVTLSLLDQFHHENISLHSNCLFEDEIMCCYYSKKTLLLSI